MKKLDDESDGHDSLPISDMFNYFRMILLMGISKFQRHSTHKFPAPLYLYGYAYVYVYVYPFMRTHYNIMAMILFLLFIYIFILSKLIRLHIFICMSLWKFIILIKRRNSLCSTSNREYCRSQVSHLP